MATETVTRLKKGMTAARENLAQSALYEITSLSIGLREMDPGKDCFVTVTRGMLARIQALSEAVSECIDPGVGNRTDKALFELIECRPPSVADMRELVGQAQTNGGQAGSAA